MTKYVIYVRGVASIAWVDEDNKLVKYNRAGVVWERGKGIVK